MSKYDDEQLKQYPVKSLDGGYNAYTQSKTMVDDSEIPYGQNVQVDETFTGIVKTGGSKRVSTEVSNGNSVQVHLHKTSTNQEVIAISGSTFKRVLPTEAAITGVTPTSGQDYGAIYGPDQCSYFFNNVDNPIKYDGTSLTSLSSNLPTNGCAELAEIAYNRMYVVDRVDRRKVNFSGMFNPDGTFNYFMDFRSTQPYYGGYFIMPDKVTAMYNSVNGLLIATEGDEIYQATPSTDALNGTSAAHSIQVIVRGAGITANNTTIQVGNDTHFAYNNGWYSLGIQQLYGNILRAAVLSKRIKPEILTAKNKSKEAAAFFNDAVYLAYGSGDFNSRVEKMTFKDKNFQLSAWSAPIVGWNVKNFIVYTDSDGVKHLIGGSSDPSDSYVYEYDTGSNNIDAVDSYFETKSFDCNMPGVIKYFAFIDVFYSTIFGTLSYEVYINETKKITDTVQLGNSTNAGAGSGSMPTGSKSSGSNYDPNTTFATLQQNSSFRIPCNFERGDKISIRFYNSNLDESFKINNLIIYYQPGSVYEQ